MTASDGSRTQVAPDEAQAWIIPASAFIGSRFLPLAIGRGFYSDVGAPIPDHLRMHLALRVLLI